MYVHVPFCTKRCDYCAFATWTDRDHLQPAYAEALRAEIRCAVDGGMAAATSVFFGGGTPSLLAPELLTEVLREIPRVGGAEVTVECNPDTVTMSSLAHYRAHGVNRLSFGVQSMVPHVLAALGRTHDPANVEAAVAAARSAGFERFNLDLIYGGTGETVDDWRTTLERVLAFEPPHVSAYALTVEAGTPLASDRSRHPDDDDQADKYLLAEELLTAAGLANYEISNWAAPGAECRHNWLYWEQGDYRGIGCAAHSHDRRSPTGHRRWWNVRLPERYIERIGESGSAEAMSETLDAQAARVERLQLALRTRAGVAATVFTDEDRAELLEAGLLGTRGDGVMLTPAGRLMANAVSIRMH